MTAVVGPDPGFYTTLLTIPEIPVTEPRSTRDDQTPSYYAITQIPRNGVGDVGAADEDDDKEEEEDTESGQSEEGEEEDEEDEDGSGYETDLDIEKDKERRKKPKERDDIDAYKQACEDLGAVLQRAVLDQISNTDMILGYRNIGALGAKALAHAFMQNIHVEYLDLKYNGLGGEGALYICEMLLENDTLQILDLSGNELKTQGAMAISEMMRLNKGLSHLIITCNNFVDSDGEILAAGLQVSDKIKELDVSNNGFSIRGGRAFGLALTNNYTLKYLNLSWNHIRDKGAVALCKGLQDNIALTHLNLSHNGFGYEGSVAIEKLLKANSIIKYLDIGYNRITWDAALLICNGIKANDTLDILKLGGNPITTTGCLDIIEAIADSKSVIKELDLEGVCVLGEFDMMASVIQNNREFKYRHGGVVGTHDVLGERHGKKITPMQRVIDYMKKTGIRPTELFRSMDKQVSKKISHQEMIARLKKSGVEMHIHEAIELIDHLERNASDLGESNSVNYKNISRCVKDQIIKDRNEKIKERERLKKLNDYHQTILQKGRLPPISDEGEARTITLPSNYETGSLQSFGRLSLDTTTTPAAQRHLVSARSQNSAPDFNRIRHEELVKAMEASGQRDKMAAGGILKGNLTKAVYGRSISVSAMSIPSELIYYGNPPDPGSSTGSSWLTRNAPLRKNTSILSMAQPLGSKAKPFGATKKKRKKKSKKHKAKRS